MIVVSRDPLVAKNVTSKQRQEEYETTNTFEEFVKKLPTIFQRIIGKVEYETIPQIEDKQSSLVIATDGTVTKGYGGAAVIIEDSRGGKLRSYLPVDGNPEQMDYFRVELCGILA